jgi:hypothetical protein
MNFFDKFNHKIVPRSEHEHEGDAILSKIHSENMKRLERNHVNDDQAIFVKEPSVPVRQSSSFPMQITPNRSVIPQNQIKRSITNQTFFSDHPVYENHSLPSESPTAEKQEIQNTNTIDSTSSAAKSPLKEKSQMNCVDIDFEEISRKSVLKDSNFCIPISNQFLSFYNNPCFSDVKVTYLDRVFHLHKVVICRCPVFSKVPNIRTVDTINMTSLNVDINSLESILGWMYGIQIEITSQNILKILCCAFFFQIKEIVDLCLEKISEDLSSENLNSNPPDESVLLSYIYFVDNYEFGSISERIEDFLLNYLCFEGYQMPSLFKVLPLIWFQRIVEADAFWCPGEFERYEFVKTVILQRKIEDLKKEKDFISNSNDVYAEIFQNAIIYNNMSFEELSQVREDKIVSDSLLMKCHWEQTKFKRLVENADVTCTSFIKEDSDPWVGELTNSAEGENPMIPLRVGIEFTDLTNITTERVFSEPFFYGGSWWSVFLQRFQNDEGLEKWGVFVRRSRTRQGGTNGDESNTKDISSKQSISVFQDQRAVVNAVFKLFNPWIKTYEPIFESRINGFADTQSWGYRSRENIVTLRHLNSDSNMSLRLTVVIKLA